MHASVTAGPPRLITVSSRPNSSCFVPLDRESTGYSSLDNEQPKRIAMYSTFPSPSLGDDPRKESDTRSQASSMSNVTSMRTRTPIRPRSPPKFRNSRRPTPRDPALLEDDRQGIQELADFLRTKEPPPNHYMSIPEAPTKSLASKRSILNFFQRRSSRSSKPPKLIKLPDTAVASTTSGGFRHIAISIPTGHDYARPGQRSVSLQAVCEPALRTYSEKGSSLRTVAEHYEPDFVGSMRGSFEESIHNNRVDLGALAEGRRFPADLQDTNSLRYYRPRMNRHSQTPSLETSISRRDFSQLQRELFEQSITGWSLGSSTVVDRRQSGCTVYSDRTLASSSRHGYGPSRSSTGMNQKNIPIPTQTSTPAKASPSRGRSEGEVTPRSRKGHKVNTSIASGKSINESLYSVASIHTAGVVDLQGPPNPGPTSQQLDTFPSVPTGKSDHIRTSFSRPSTAPSQRHSKRLSGSHKGPPQSFGSVDEGATRFINPDRQVRLDRVKAKKQRDIALLKENKANQLYLSDYHSAHGSQGFGRLESARTDRSRRRHSNASAPIMPVPDIQVTNGPAAVFRMGCISKQTSMPFTHTPPRSLSASSESDGEYISRMHNKRPIESPPYSVASARSRRESLLSQHSKVALERESELDQRLLTIERENAMLRNTLNRMSSGASGASSYNPGSIANRTWGAVSQRRGPSQINGLHSIDPLMRELQSAARLSCEVPWEMEYEDDTDYEN
ncbi:hypothetical protein PVAG01_06475 [Phlyctema vagabunda]|uniref:Uncharacterized protein n=1 Tax=Phlyctema vagabunda TaxID=108571 RepID=A0ABR4PG87_9HELO